MEVPERGAVAAREDRGQHVALVGDSRVPDGVHTPVEPMEAPAVDTPLDAVSVQPGPEELREPDDAVLARGDSGDQFVGGGCGKARIPRRLCTHPRSIGPVPATELHAFATKPCRMCAKHAG